MSMRKAIVFSSLVALSGLAYANEKGSTADMVKMMDTDSDGQVSAAEYTAKSGKTQADFDMMDMDKDGFATSAEMDAHMSMMNNDSGQMDQPTRTDSMSSEGTSTTPPPASTPMSDGG